MTTPPKCPNCSGGEIKEIFYGMPVFSKDPKYKDMYKNVIMAGCVVERDSPQWHCTRCSAEWGTTEGSYRDPNKVTFDNRQEELSQMMDYLRDEEKRQQKAARIYMLTSVALVIVVAVLFALYRNKTPTQYVGLDANSSGSGQVLPLQITIQRAQSDGNIRYVKAVTDEVSGRSSCLWYGLTGISGYTATTQGEFDSLPPWTHTMTLLCPDPPTPDSSDTGDISFNAYCRTKTGEEYRVSETIVRWDDSVCK